MANIKKYRRLSRRIRRFNRRGVKALQYNQISLNQAPAHQQNATRATLRWGDSQTGALTAGTRQGFVFSINGLFDPNTATGLGQISYKGYAEMMALHEYSEALSTLIECKFSMSSAGPALCDVIVALDNNATIPTTLQTAMCEGWSQEFMTQNSFGSGNPLNYRRYVKIAKELSKTVGQESLKGTIAAVPSDQLYLKIFIYNPSNISVDYQILTKFTSNCLFTQKLL